MELGRGGGEPPRGGSISGYAIKRIIRLGWVEVPIIVIEGGGYVGVTVEVNKYVVLSPRIPTFWAEPILAAITVGCQGDPPPIDFGLYDFRADMVRGVGGYGIEIEAAIPDRQVYEISGGANLLGGDIWGVIGAVKIRWQGIVREK